MNDGWVLVDGTQNEHVFYYGKGRWGKDRERTLIYKDHEKVLRDATIHKAACMEVSTDMKPFIVLEWRYKHHIDDTVKRSGI